MPALACLDDMSLLEGWQERIFDCIVSLQNQHQFTSAIALLKAIELLPAGQRCSSCWQGR